MGSGIVTALVLSNISVVLKELNGTFLEQGINRIKGRKHYTQLSFVLFFNEEDSLYIQDHIDEGEAYW